MRQCNVCVRPLLKRRLKRMDSSVGRDVYKMNEEARSALGSP